MVSPMRPFPCLFKSVAKQGGKRQFPNLARMCCWDRDRSWTKLIFSCFVCLKNVIFVLECFKICVLWNLGPICILVMMGWKNWLEYVITFISPIIMNELKTASSLLKGPSHAKTHVTLIQEMNGQWDVWHSIDQLWQQVSFVQTD